MPLEPGARLGVYEIIGAIGAGAMGEVYRARDTKLNRDVAIKILPAHLAADNGASQARPGSDRMARFEREAQVLASLNHPHIAQIYGVEESVPSTSSGQAAVRAIVMELVEGEDLAERIAKGPIPVDEALPLARQIAEALEAAHEIGVIHRDLKPANIKLRADGTIKVLDFGLAKAVNPDASSSVDPMQSPTLTAHATGIGMILGTAAYMAPEQARGKVVDRRADVWAFGCVLYEMLTGRRTFASDDVTDTLTAVLRDPPDWNALPAETPAAVRSLLARCLDKDPKQRLRDIGEARVALSSGSPVPAAAAVAPAPAALPPRRRSLLWAAVVLLTAAVVGLAALVAYRQRPAGVPQVHKTYVALRPDGSSIRFPALSPDGRKVVYAARSRLWVQALDEWEPRELAGTEGGVKPFWSPASDWIGFFRNEQLLKIPAAGGPVVSIASLPAVQAPLFSSSAVWNDDGTIFISQAAGPQIYRVPGSGGELKEHYKLPDAMGFDVHDLAPLPGGAIVMAIHRADGVGALAVLADGNLTIVLEASNVGHPQYSPSGHLVFARAAPNAGLWAMPFNAPGRTVTGEPFLIGRGTEPSLARDGTLVFLGAEHVMERRLAWFTMDGRVGDTIAPPQNWIEGAALAPGGNRLVASADDGLWSYDLAGGARSRVTNGRSDMMPQWVGKTGLTFVRTVNGTPTLFLKRTDAVGEEHVLVENARFPTVTADGRRIVFNRRPPGDRAWEVAWLDVDRPAEVHALGPAHGGARFPAVSPDGRLVAYVSGEIGNDEVFLTRFPSGEGKWQLSTEGGGWCRFTPKGDAVVYRTLGGDLMSVPVTLGAEVTIGRPRKLFEWGSGWMLFYELAPDGTRGIAAVPVGEANDLSSLSLVQNWHAEFIGR